MSQNSINNTVTLTLCDGDKELAKLHLNDAMGDLLRKGKVLDIRIGGYDEHLMICEVDYFPDRQPPEPLPKTVRIV